MTGALPTPRVMFSRLAAVFALAGVGSAALWWLVARFVLPAGSSAPEPGLVGPLVMAGALAPTGAAAAWLVVRRCSVIYRVRRRGAGAGLGAPPPSVAALRDLFAAPSRAVIAAGAVLAVVALLDVAGAFGAAGGLGHRLARGLLWLALGIAAIEPLWVAWRRTLEPWVAGIHPAEFPLAAGAALARRTSLRVALPVSAVALGTGAVVAGELDRVAPPGSAFAPLVALLVAVAAAAVAAAATLRGHRLGGAAAADLASLASEVGRLAEADRPEVPGGLVELHRTRAARELAAAVVALAERYEEAVAQEARSRAAIEHAQRLKSRFMAFMSHDLRSPLNAIRGFAQLLASGDDGPLNAEQRQSVEMIRESGDELLRLVDDILDSAKLEAGRLELEPHWTPSVEILTDAVRRARQLVGNKPLEIVTEFEPGLPPVRVDRDRVVQAVAGVIEHVVRVMRKGTIRLRARLVRAPTGIPRQLLVEVTDVSGSIRHEDRERLFDAFRALRERSGRRIGGLGLGLFLARSLVTAHGGELWYETHGEQGITFCVALPLDEH